MNKRNFLKALSSAILGTLTVGNFSNVRMMEPNSKKMELTDKQYEEISKQKNENFLKKRAALMHSKKADEMGDNYASKAMEKQKKSFEEINADFQDTSARVRFGNVIENLKVKYKNGRTAVKEVSEKLNELLGKQFNENDDLSAIQGISILLAEYIVYYSRINNVNVKNTNLIDSVMINVCDKFSFGFSNIDIKYVIKQLECIVEKVIKNTQ